MVQVYLELMNHHLCVNFGHVSVRPVKAIMVLLKEVDEVFTEIWLQMSSNMNFVIRQVRVNGNII